MASSCRRSRLTSTSRRIESRPEKYLKKLYGAEEAGGTSVIYLTSLPFDELDLAEPITISQACGLGDLLIREVDTDHPPGLSDLTPREAELLELMAGGLNNDAIAERLSSSRQAVEKSANQVFQKLGVGGERQISPRVMATLIFLRSRDG